MGTVLLHSCYACDAAAEINLSPDMRSGPPPQPPIAVQVNLASAFQVKFKVNGESDSKL